jgi:hypothetical protein
MSFLEQSSPSGLTTVTMDEAHHYNLLIAAHSFQQIYSNSENYLKALQVMRRTSLSRENA